MTRFFLPIFFLLFFPASLPTTHAEPPVSPADLRGKFNPVPEWFQDAKFGIYFHWGVYSVPAFDDEWYPRWMHFEGHPVYQHHLEKYGHPSEFGYHDFVPLFRAEHFDARDWAKLFKAAGARFAGPVAEHHDGFSMWDSDRTPWNAADKGPRVDITGELAKAIRAEGMKLVTTFHHARNLQRPDLPGEPYPNRMHFRASHYPPVPGMPPSLDDPELKYLYGRLPEDKWLREVWFGKLTEVVDKYSPDVIWFDSWLDRIPEGYRMGFLQYYYEHALRLGKEVVVTYKQDDLPPDLAVFNIEKGGMVEISPAVWQSDDTISMGSWCYTEDLEIKPSSMVLHSLVDIVSKNGVLLLNISPRADGVIPQNQRQVLLDIGAWLEIHGEAIYATRPWIVHGEGPTGFSEGRFGGMATTNVYTPEDKRYTRSRDGRTVYATVLGKPAPGSQIRLQVFGQGNPAQDVGVSSVELVGGKGKVAWKREATGIIITAPARVPSDQACVYRLEVSP